METNVLISEQMEFLKGIFKIYHNFPKPGVDFVDIMPALRKPFLREIIETGLASQFFSIKGVGAVIGIETRGYIFVNELANESKSELLLARKPGKLPGPVERIKYLLEYGEEILEIQADVITPGMRVVIHDDVLATGGTAAALAELVVRCGGIVAGFSFIVELPFLNGREKLISFSDNISSLVSYTEDELKNKK